VVSQETRIESLVNALRTLADERHKDVLLAIDRIASYLSDSKNLDREVSESLRELISRTSSRAAIRERVLSSLGKDSLSILELAVKTGLTEKQVRGVLYSKQVKDRVNRSRMYGETRFSAKLSTSKALGSQDFVVPGIRRNDLHALREA